MHESLLAAFFDGRATAEELACNICGSRVHLSDVETRTKIHDMPGTFRVTRQMAVLLCDAVLAGSLPAEDLEVIGFTLIASDAFFWDEHDDEPAETFWDWAAPEINFELALDNVRMFRRRLARESA